METIYQDLADKKILITGASRGIGREIAKSLARQKAHVIFNYRKMNESIESLISELKEHTSQVDALEFDITDFEKVKDSLDSFQKEKGPIEGLGNNAGISKDALIMRLKEEDISSILDVNLKAAIMLTSFLSRGFLRAKNVSVVNVSSVVGMMGNTSQTVYAASKAGLIGFTKSMAKELASRNIRCNAIAPGFIETDMTEALDEKVKEHYLSSIPLQRMGSCSEIANLVNFLLSSNSGYITGEVIKIDGGLYI